MLRCIWATLQGTFRTWEKNNFFCFRDLFKKKLYACVSYLRGQTRSLSPFGSRVMGDCELPKWVLGTKVGSSARAVCALNR